MRVLLYWALPQLRYITRFMKSWNYTVNLKIPDRECKGTNVNLNSRDADRNSPTVEMVATIFSNMRIAG